MVRLILFLLVFSSFLSFGQSYPSHDTLDRIGDFYQVNGTQSFTGGVRLIGGFYVNPNIDSFQLLTIDTLGNLWWHNNTGWLEISGGGGGGNTYFSGYGLLLNSFTFKVDTTLITSRARFATLGTGAYMSPSATLPISITTGGIISETQASTTQSGWISSIDWNIFNGKLSSITGTTNRITVTGTTIDISASYIGQSSITTVGTVTTGSIQDGAIASASNWNSKQVALGFTPYTPSQVNINIHDTANVLRTLISSNTSMVSIGDTIHGATPYSLLFVDVNGKLQTSNNFYYDGTTTNITTNNFNLGNNGAANQTSISGNDASGFISSTEYAWYFNVPNVGAVAQFGDGSVGSTDHWWANGDYQGSVNHTAIVGSDNAKNITLRADNGFTLSSLNPNTLLWLNGSNNVSNITLGSGISLNSGTGILSATGTGGTVVNVVPGTNISITGTSTIQPTINISGTISLANGGTGATTQTSINTTPIINGANNSLNIGVTSIIAGTGLIGGTIISSGTLALATINANPATYGTSTQIPVVVVNAYGQVTGVTNTSIGTLNQNTTGNAATVTTNANLTGPVTSVGNATTISNSGVSAGSYGSATIIPGYTVNAAGQITAVTSYTVTGGGGGTPGGSNTQIQYNNSGSFAGSSNLTFDGTNMAVNNIIYGVQSYTATGTQTITVLSPRTQRFFGTTATLVMPVTSTVKSNQDWDIVNDGSGNLTINSSGGNLIQTLHTKERCRIVDTAITGTTAIAWYVTSFQSKVDNAGNVTMAGNLTLPASGSVTINSTTMSSSFYQTLGYVGANGGFLSDFGTPTSGNFNIGNGSGSSTADGSINSTFSGYRISGGASVNFRTAFGGSTSTVATIGSDIENIIFSNGLNTTAASGTHGWGFNVGIDVFSPTIGTATITNAASLYVKGNAINATNNYGIWDGGNLYTVGTLFAPHIEGNGGTPTIIAGVGAGTSPTVSISGTDYCMRVTVTTGTLPTGATTVATVTYNSAWVATPFPVFSPANANAASLSGLTMVYMAGASTTTYLISVGTTGLTASTTYKWNVFTGK